jgi:maleylacetoacetate isomerase
VKLYTFWRSQAAFRVRIALNLKGLTREDIAINLDRGDQFKPGYKAHNPQAVVPTLYDGDFKLFQSMAILEYLEEKYPNPPILPKDPLARAWVRGFALINAADSHPLIVPRIRKLSRKRAEGRRSRPHRLDPALARRPGCRRWRRCWRRSAGRQVLPRQQPDRRRYLPGNASDPGAAIQVQS